MINIIIRSDVKYILICVIVYNVVKSDKILVFLYWLCYFLIIKNIFYIFVVILSIKVVCKIIFKFNFRRFENSSIDRIKLNR